MSYSCKLLQEKINELYDKRETDYLIEYPYLTLLGRTAGLSDDTIRKINKKIVENPDDLLKIYSECE